LGSAGSLAQPTTQFGVLTSPLTGNSVSNGNVSSLAFQGGQVQNAQTAGGKYNQNLALIASGQNQISSLGQLFGVSNPADPSNVPLINSVYNTWSRLGQSDSRYQQLQDIISGINQAYSLVLGTAVDVNSLAAQQGGDIMSVLNSLNQRAIKANNYLKSTAISGTLPPQPQTQAPQSNQKIHVQIGNQTGTIDASDFNPQTMKQIP
jgi:hypothetical protein